MPTFDPNHYGPVFADLLGVTRLPPLDGGTPNASVQSQLRRMTVVDAFAHTLIADRDMASCCLAGIWLYHDFLDESHKIAQDIGSASGSYWHAIMHRRESDYSNSKYWFRRVGSHAIFAELHSAAAELASAHGNPAGDFLATQSSWDPFAFVDLCEQCARKPSGNEQLCMEVQKMEWELLFDYCYRQAQRH